MGCSSSERKMEKNNEFYQEAMGFKSKNLKGLHVDENFSSMQTMKEISAINGVKFSEELIDHADEAGCVKPWLVNVIPPEYDLEEDMGYPKYNLKIDHIFGFRIEDCRQNLFYYGKDQWLYISSSLGIIQNVDDLSMTLFGGVNSNESSECHDNDIMSLGFYRGDVSMVATGQRGMKPMILVWSPIDTSIVYAKFHQPKGSKEVSALDFDKDGHYVGSFGKDEKNTFYIFDLQTKNLFWSQETGGDNEFLLDLVFNPLKNEICIVGVNKIIFGFLDRKTFSNVYQKTSTLAIFTSACYLSKGECLIASDNGKVGVYISNILTSEFSVSSGSIQNITHSTKFNKVYVTDSLSYVYVYDDSEIKRLDKFRMNSIVKAWDVNDEEDIVMGLKTGEIIIKHYKNVNKTEETFLKSHCEGSIRGWDFIPEYRAITSGEDNQILLWNLRSKKCENHSKINPVIPEYTNAPGKGEIAVGINNGHVSIRKGIKYLDIKIIPDIILGNSPVTQLKYTNYGDLLLACCENGEITLFDTNVNYSVKGKLTIVSYITAFDFDQTSKFIQAVTKSNEYVFINLEKMEVVNDPWKVKSVEWPNITCKFGYTVQGVYLGSTDPDFITCVSKAHSKKIIWSGDDDRWVNLYNYPTICENPKVKSYPGHSGHIIKIWFCQNDEKVLTIAEEDKTLILWTWENE